MGQFNWKPPADAVAVEDNSNGWKPPADAIPVGLKKKVDLAGGSPPSATGSKRSPNTDYNWAQGQEDARNATSIANAPVWNPKSPEGQAAIKQYTQAQAHTPKAKETTDQLKTIFPGIDKHVAKSTGELTPYSFVGAINSKLGDLTDAVSNLLKTGAKYDYTGIMSHAADATDATTDFLKAGEKAHPMINGIVGDVVKGVAQTLPAIAGAYATGGGTIATEGAELTGHYLSNSQLLAQSLRTAANPITRYMAGEGALTGAGSEAKRTNGQILPMLLGGLHGATEGVQQGIMLSGSMNAGEQIGGKLFGLAKKLGVTNSDGIITEQALKSLVGTPVSFATSSMAEDLANGRPIDLRKAGVSGLSVLPYEAGHMIGAVKGAEELKQQKTAIDEAAQTVGANRVMNFLTATPDDITKTIALPESADELQIKSLGKGVSAQKAEILADKNAAHLEQLSLQQQADVKGVVDHILADKDGFIKSVEASDLEPDDKSALIQKANDIHKQYDPIEQKKTELGKQITQLDQSIVQSDDPVIAAENEVKQEKRKELNNNLKQIIIDQNESTKETIPKSSESSSQVDNQKVADEEVQVEKPTISVREFLDKPITYHGEPAEIVQDGQTLVAKIKGGDREYELGNVDEIGDKSIKDLGIEHQNSVVDTHENGNVLVRGKEYVNNYSDPKSAINVDGDGNVVSVNLETPDGKKRTFKGDVAEDIAYQIHLKELNKDNETKQQFEQFVNEHEPSKSAIVSAENANTAEKATVADNAEVPRKPKRKVNEQAKVPEIPKGKAVAKNLTTPEHTEANELLKEHGVTTQDLADHEERNTSSEKNTPATTDAKTVQRAGNDGVGNDGKNSTGEKAKQLADRIRALKTSRDNLHGGLQGVAAAFYDGALETVATAIEQGGKLADAIQAGIDYIKAKHPDIEDSDISAQIRKDLELAGIKAYDDPEMIEANNAFMDAKVSGKFGVGALDEIISKLKDTDLKNIVAKVKGKIERKATYLEDTRKRVMKNQGGSEEDQAALLLDQYHLKGQENSLIDEINNEPDADKIQEHQKALEQVQNDILDNAVANRMIGREASSIFRLRQVAVDQDANLQTMREKFMATEGTKELTPEQEAHIKQQYEGIKAAEREVARLKAAGKATREENERLQSENDALKKIIDNAKKKHESSKEKTTDRLTTIRKSIDNSKKELGKIFSANAFLNPEIYKHIRNIAIGKAEEAYVRTKSAIDLNGLVKSVLDELKDVAPKLTERDVRDAISGNHEKAKPKLKSDLQKNIAELKSQASVISKINDLENGIIAAVKSKGESSPKVKELRKQLADLKKTSKLDSDYQAMQDGTLDVSTKPTTKSPIDERQWNINRYKEIKRQIAETQGRIDRGEFTTPEKEAKRFEKSKELQAAERELAVKKFQWDKERKQALLKNRPWWQKAIDNVVAWQKFAVLSYPSTLLKLVSTALQGVALKPFQLAYQELAYRILPKNVSGIIGGKVRAEAVVDFYSKFIRQFSFENVKNHLKGRDEAEIMYGSPRYEDDGISLGERYNNFIQFPGRSHGLIKSFLKAPETAFARKQLLLGYVDRSAEIESQLKNADLTQSKRSELESLRSQYDISNDDVLDRIETLANNQGKWAILMNDNHVVEKFRNFMGQLGIVGDIGKTELPVLKIPMNYVNRYFEMKLGLLHAVLGKRNFIKKGELEYPGLVHHFLKGSEKMTDQQKELLSRSFVYGSMGASMFVAGYLLHNQIKHNDDGSVTVAGTKLNKNVVHNPLIDNILSGAETAQRFEKVRGKKGAADWVEAYAKSDIDVIKKMPFTSQLKYGFTAQLAQAIYMKKEETASKMAGRALDKKIADMVTPGFMKEWAEMQDKNALGKVNKRNPRNLLDHLKLAIPGLRKTVPRK